MEPSESVFDNENWEEDLDDDVVMLDAEPMHAHCSLARSSLGVCAGGGQGCEESHNDRGGEDVLDNGMGKARRKTKKKKKRKGCSSANITDINRFVINTCRQLKEKKSYLIWNAVGCLGVSAINDLVKEVDAIQHCGGQKTVDGKRFRTGGGVLWNILKAREPKAYKEIMAKGREFEKQFKQTHNNQSRKNEDLVSQPKTVHCSAVEGPARGDFSCLQQEKHASESHNRPLSVRDRLRVPVTYDDNLLEEGEIHEALLL